MPCSLLPHNVVKPSRLIANIIQYALNQHSGKAVAEHSAICFGTADTTPLSDTPQIARAGPVIYSNGMPEIPPGHAGRPSSSDHLPLLPAQL